MQGKELFVLFVLGSLCISATAQNYNFALGLRAGYTVGITGKGFLDSEKALEGILYLREEGIGITGLYEKHAEAFGVSQLQWFYGIGAHLGWWYEDRRWNRPLFTEETNSIGGIDGIIGLEYTIKDIPFCISVDYKPLINLFGDGNGPRFRNGGAISVRYVF